MSPKALFLMQIAIFLLLTFYQLWNLSLSMHQSSAQAINFPHQLFCSGPGKSISPPSSTLIELPDPPVDKNSFGACLIIQGKMNGRTLIALQLPKFF
jgi:hypothetical protein